MNSRLKCYQVTLTTLSPVHIGDGTEIKKNEYIYDFGRKQIHVMDIRKLFSELTPSLQDEFERFFITGSVGSLKDWLRVKRNFTIKEQYQQYIKYSMNSISPEDTKRKRGGAPALCDIRAFVKDPFGQPYIPGSSIKGMLRTALLAYELYKDGQRPDDQMKYRAQINQLSNHSLYEENECDRTYGNKRRVNSKSFLNQEIGELEKAVFNTLNREGTRSDDAVNCTLAGLIIGDSEPLTASNLIVCQKCDRKPHVSEDTLLPIYKECLAPGIKVSFKLTLDSGLCPYDIAQIREAIVIQNKNIVTGFLKKFDHDVMPAGNECIGYLGGGAGFASKTINEALCQVDQESSLQMNDDIFRQTLGPNYRRHKHDLDVDKYRVSPHMRKLTKYQNQYYDMGKIRLDFNEIEI